MDDMWPPSFTFACLYLSVWDKGYCFLLRKSWEDIFLIKANRCFSISGLIRKSNLSWGSYHCRMMGIAMPVRCAFVISSAFRTAKVLATGSHMIVSIRIFHENLKIIKPLPISLSWLFIQLTSLSNAERFACLLQRIVKRLDTSVEMPRFHQFTAQAFSGCCLCFRQAC